MADLPTNYRDDILSESMNGKKKFRLTYRNGTTEDVTIEDISEYVQYGSKFGAGDINKINHTINEKFDSGDVVDPMMTTENGFAADALKVKIQFSKVGSKLTSLEENFSSATNDLGTLLVAKGIPVPSGASLLDMIQLLNNVTFVSTLNPIEIFSSDNQNLSGGWTNKNIDTGECTTNVGSASGDTNNYINLTDVSNISVELSAAEEKEVTPLYCRVYLISADNGETITVANKAVEKGTGSISVNIANYKGRYKIRVGVEVTYAPNSSMARIYVKGVKLY